MITPEDLNKRDEVLKLFIKKSMGFRLNQLDTLSELSLNEDILRAFGESSLAEANPEAREQHRLRGALWHFAVVRTSADGLVELKRLLARQRRRPQATARGRDLIAACEMIRLRPRRSRFSDCWAQHRDQRLRPAR